MNHAHGTAPRIASRPRSAAARSILVTALTLAWVAPATVTGQEQDGSAEQDVAETIQMTRDTLEQVTELEKQIATARSQWRVGEEVLRERIQVVQREIDALNEDITNMRDDITEIDTEREKLVEENERLKNTASVLRDTVSQYETRTKALIAKLPPPAVELIRPLSQRLPDDSNDTEVSLSNRYQNVIGILNELDKFNQKVTTSSQTREVAPGDPREVNTLYVGLGASYYAGPNGAVGGRGFPSDEGWQWTARDEAAQEIATAFRIFNNEETAAFVLLPIEVGHHAHSATDDAAVSDTAENAAENAAEDAAEDEAAPSSDAETSTADPATATDSDTGSETETASSPNAESPDALSTPATPESAPETTPDSSTDPAADADTDAAASE